MCDRERVGKGVLCLAAFVVWSPFVTTGVRAQDEVLVVERLPGGTDAHYVSRRAPLEPSPLVELPIGSVRPRGWLLTCLERQRDGLVGQLGHVSAWLTKDGNAWLAPDGRGDWGWEEVPYWLKGYIELAHLLQDPEMIAEANVWIEAALASRRDDGNFGPVRRFDDDGSQDFWANMVMLFCLQTHYEATNDERVLALMRAYFRYQLGVPDAAFLTHYWQHMRGGDNLYSVYWLYDRMGEPWLLELGAKLHRHTVDWGRAEGLPNLHNVNVAQGFREPATWFQQSHDRKDLDASYRAFRSVRERFGQVPGGMFGGDENCREGFTDPRQAIETCGSVEQMASDEILFRITGDPSWAEHCEEVAFNTWPPAFTADQRALRYLTSPNHVVSDSENHAPGIENGGAFLVMNPLSHRCCQHNASHGWTSFTKNLWSATTDGGLCVGMYAPCIVRARVGRGEGASVAIEVDTRYPFEETVRLRVRLAGEATFPLYLRFPTWCDRVTLRLNGEEHDVSRAGGSSVFLRLQRSWKDGDRVELRLPMDVRVTRWPENHGAVSVQRGPLTYSLHIEERHVTVDPAKTALPGSRWQEGLDLSAWPATEIYPASPWNYGLILPERDPSTAFTVERRPWPADDFPFVADGAPIVLHATARRIPAWQLDRFGLAAELQDGPVFSAEPDEPIQLVPMGGARLRISAFPVIATGENGVLWKEPRRPRQRFEVLASHCFAGDRADAVADDLEPSSSDDHGIARHTFWPHLGTSEWIEARFASPRTVERVALYWFDDRTSGGRCRVPKTWRLFARVGDAWQPLAPDQEHGVAMDRWNELVFKAVTTDRLRLEVDLREGVSAGVLEWKVE